VQKVSLVTDIAARLAMALGRLEENQAAPSFEKFLEANTLKAAQKE
jgi:hypothetical protein